MRSQLESEVFLGPDNLPHHISGVHERVSGTYQAVSVDTSTAKQASFLRAAKACQIDSGK